jgi:hypothetical protein
MYRFAFACCLAIGGAAPSALARGEPEGGLFLQGFDVSWRRRPHRLSHLFVEAASVASPDGGPLRGVLRAGLRGGSWASGERGFDTPSLTVRYGALLGERLRFWQGAADLAIEGQRGRGRPPGFAAEGVTRVSLDLGIDPNEEAVAVWLTGFDLAVDPLHPDGYTLEGLAVSLGVPRVEAGVVSFDVAARLVAGPVPDRRQRLARYGSTARIGYAVVVAPNGLARRFGVRANDGLTGKREPARIAVNVPCAAGQPITIAGLSGFFLGLTRTGTSSGRYLRALTVGLEAGRYDGGRGTYDALVALRLTNAGPLRRPTEVDASAEFTLLQLPEPADAREGRWSPAEEGQTHEAAYP